MPGWRYRPVWLPAKDRQGRAFEAFSLMADGVAEDSHPSLRYITLLREGARRHSLPTHWIEKLELVRSADDTP